MAPMKRPREAGNRNAADKSKRSRRPKDTDSLYKCLDKLYGDEAEQDRMSVADNLGSGGGPGGSGSNNNNPARSTKRRTDEIVEMDATEPHTDFSDEEFDDVPSQPSKSGRVNRHKMRKASISQPTELQIGVRKAKRYICEALDFGVQSGFLTPKDSKGKVLRVSSDLLQTNDPDKARVLQRVVTDPTEARLERRNARKRRRESPELLEDGEPMEGGGEVEERSHGRRHGRKRSGSRRRGKKSSRRSRSRSRSKRRHGRKRADRREARSRSLNPSGADGIPKQVAPNGEEGEQEEMDEDNNKELGSGSAASSRNEHDNDDSKSINSGKSESQPNSESQTTNEDKKQQQHDDDASYEGSDDDEKK